ncbi:MAG: D-alanyl-D-alanine carboxypeptidase family protein, partial [Acidimicrobiia bacterium]|nr:D-alanyl-D-alanine carboxypeptidase family protein [Acidimicrobiia bacterium]
LLAALDRADALLGAPVPVVSGFRSRAEQEALWAARATNPYPVAPPGTSMHEHGLAIDVPSSFAPTLLAVAATAGLCQVLPQSDPIHFEPCPPSSPR